MNRIALTIGNDRYEKLPELRTAVSDVVAVSEVLTEAGFEVTRVIDADYRTMTRALRTFAASLRHGDTGLFWFAGHGAQFNHQNYLIPIDAELSVRILIV